MVPSMRKWFNENFSEPVYKAYLGSTGMPKYPGALEFRAAETPVFAIKFYRQNAFACESIIDVVTQYNFKHLRRMLYLLT